MKTLILILLLIWGVALEGQAPASGSAGPRTYTSELGFTYAIPGDWDVMDKPVKAPQATQPAGENSAADENKKALACLQVGMTARHGMPGSVIAEVELPFDCVGQRVSENELPQIGEGASQGVKESFDIAEPSFGTYTLGSHPLWMERAQGTPKGQAGPIYTVEIACTLLKRAAVCWLAIAADDEALKTFERGKVSLDGEAPTELVPATVVPKKHS